MNNKVSKIQIGMFLSLICCSLYLGLGDIILPRKSGSVVLISMIIGTIIGLILVMMYLKINSTLPKLNIYNKNIKLFGKFFGNIFNIFILTIYLFMFMVATRSITIFVSSKYLQSTSYVLIGALVVITSLIICFKGIEVIARVAQLSFFASLLFMIVIEFFLLQYIEIENVLPLVTNNPIKDIISGATYHVATCSILTMLLLTISKSSIKDSKKYNKTIIIFYLLGSLSLCFVMFFVIACFGYNTSSLFRYPEYILLKKIGISDFELHLENLLAFRWIFYILSLANISLYGIISGISNYTKNVKVKNIITIILSFIVMIIGKNIFGNIPHSIIFFKDSYVWFIALPMFIMFLIIYLRCFKVKDKS